MVYVHGPVTITEDFDTWRAMIEGAKAEMDEIGMKVLFATTEAGDDTQGLIAGTEAHSTALAAAFVNIFIRHHQASILRVNSIFYLCL